MPSEFTLFLVLWTRETEKISHLTNAFTESREEFGWGNARISTYLLEKREFICYITPVAAFSGEYRRSRVKSLISNVCARTSMKDRLNERDVRPVELLDSVRCDR